VSSLIADPLNEVGGPPCKAFGLALDVNETVRPGLKLAPETNNVCSEPLGGRVEGSTPETLAWLDVEPPEGVDISVGAAGFDPHAAERKPRIGKMKAHRITVLAA